MTSDASGSWGYGVLTSDIYVSSFSGLFLRMDSFSIKELLPIVLGVAIWTTYGKATQYFV